MRCRGLGVCLWSVPGGQGCACETARGWHRAVAVARCHSALRCCYLPQPVRISAPNVKLRCHVGHVTGCCRGGELCPFIFLRAGQGGRLMLELDAGLLPRHRGVNKIPEGLWDPGPPGQAASCRTAVRLQLEGWLRHNPRAWERRARVNSNFQVREVCINKPNEARLPFPDNKHLQTMSLL